MRNAVVYGAGKIGRGFIGKKFADAFRVGDAQFRREIDLADAFGDAGLDGFVRKAGRAMQN